MQRSFKMLKQFKVQRSRFKVQRTDKALAVQGPRDSTSRENRCSLSPTRKTSGFLNCEMKNYSLSRCSLTGATSNHFILAKGLETP
jgi:hypothetical protein